MLEVSGLCSAPAESLNALKSSIQKYPFSTYAAKHWSFHAGEGKEEEIDELFRHTFEKPGRRRAIWQREEGATFKTDPQDWSLLQVAASKGLSKLCFRLVQDGNDHDSR
jgi:hypothetical protein